VPGKLNETWFNVRETGIYYGQCSELCGKDHAYMPIAIRVVTEAEFAAWMAAFQAHAHGHHDHNPTGWRRFAYSTNHKDIGTMYLIFAVVAGIIGTAMSI
jgi:heme/copper-type cytochrome/quinol oxidase subunit 2